MSELLDEKDLALIEAMVKGDGADSEPDGDPDDEEFQKLVQKFMSNGMPRAAAESAAKRALANKAKAGVSEALREPTLYDYEDELAESVRLREAAAEEGDSTEFYRRLASERRVREAALTAKKRKGLQSSDFAIPPDGYPIHDESHARNALTRVAQHGTPEEQATVKAKVKKRYPNIEVS